MADRYFHLDVAFMHKRTFDKLYDAFGHAGQLAFVALCAQAKTSPSPGTFTYENEAAGWAKLGFEGRTPEFTLDEFFTVTGRLKQTSRTARGRLTDVKITQYGRWQKDARRHTERERKARYRAQNTRDTQGDTYGTAEGTNTGQRTRSRTRTTPLPPKGQNGSTPTPHVYPCPYDGCTVTAKTANDLQAHCENMHNAPRIPEPILETIA